MPGNEDPANQDQIDTPAIPQVPRSPELPNPPDIQFKRPDLAKPRGNAGLRSGRQDHGDSSPRPRSGMSAGQLGRTGAGLSAGLTFAASVVVGVLIGGFVDSRWHHGPWGLLIFTMVGIAAGFVNLFRLLSAIDHSDAGK